MFGKRQPLHEIDTALVSGDLSEAVLPSLPFSWNKIPSFNVKEMTQFAESIMEESRANPSPAYVWSESIDFYATRAVASAEVLPLVDLVKQHGRFACKARFSAIALVHAVIEKEVFPILDLELLYRKGEIGAPEYGTGSYFTVSDEYLPYLSPVLRADSSEEVVCPPVLDKEGICYLVLSNNNQRRSKFRKRQFDGLQAITNTVWKEGRTDIFILPVACRIDYLCFTIVASPIQLWLQGEAPPRSVLPNDLDPSMLAVLSALAPNANSIWFYPSSKKIFVSCPVPEVSEDNTSQLVHLLNSLERPEITNPLVFRSLLKSLSVPVTKLGKVLSRVRLPVVKEIIVGQMIGRAAKWWIRKQLAKNCNTDDVKFFSNETVKELIQIASEYFQVPPSELETFYTKPDMYIMKWVVGLDFAKFENRPLFPHWEFLPSASSSLPSVRLICPRPVPTKPDSVSVEYACGVYRLEMAIAMGDVLESIVLIGDLVTVLLKMKRNSSLLHSRILSLCEAARLMVPLCIPVPANLVHAVLDITPSISAYQAFLNEEPTNSLGRLCLDNQMAKALFSAGQATEALTILNSVADRAEKMLGARHSVTVAVWIRKAQAIKKVLETQTEYYCLQEGIKCLNKAIRSAELSSESPVIADVLDPSSFSHHLLSLFHMWNGEPGKAVQISKVGLGRLEQHFGREHPRYLNSAFLHAKLLEGFCASAMSTDAARDAISVLEDILESLLELADENGEITADFREFIISGDQMMNKETEMKRKLAVTSLILKLNVWLLDPRTASDLLDFVVADKLNGSRGVAFLPRRAAVKETVCNLLEEKRSTVSDHHFFPVLDLSNSLPEPVLTCCHLALNAKSSGVRVSDWFTTFHQTTVRTIGGNESPNRDLLVNLFLTFVFINDNGCVYIGPLSAPLIPRPPLIEVEYPGRGVIYREWERSASLYCIDHELFN